MDNWDTEFVKFLESVTETVEQFFEEVGQAVEEIAHDFQTEVVDELELFVQDVIEPFLDVDVDISIDIRTSENFLDDLFSETDLDFNPKIRPSADYHPACINCKNFHGRIYNGTPLICGMHPYGWEGEDCPDWEEERVTSKTE